MSAGDPVPAVRACACTVVDPRHDGKRVEHAARARPGGGRRRSCHRDQPLLFVVRDQGAGWFLSWCRRENHRHHTTTGHRAATCYRQSDHPYTQARSGSSNVPRPTATSRRRSWPERKTRRRRKTRSPRRRSRRRAPRSRLRRPSLRQRVREPRRSSRSRRPRVGTHDASRTAPTEGSTDSRPPDQWPAVRLAPDSPGSRHRLTRRSWKIGGSGRATGPPVDAARTSHDR